MFAGEIGIADWHGWHITELLRAHTNQKPPQFRGHAPAKQAIGGVTIRAWVEAKLPWMGCILRTARRFNPLRVTIVDGVSQIDKDLRISASSESETPIKSTERVVQSTFV